MESINQAIVSSSVSNEDDRFLFEERSPLILPIKYNNHEVTSLELNYVSAWGETAWRRLGEILGKTSMLTYLQLWRVSNLDVVALCNGLKHNKHIKEIAFQYINLVSRRSSLRVAELGLLTLIWSMGILTLVSYQMH